MAPTSVLVVDDDPDIRALIRLILEDESYAVLLAENGGDAVDLIGRERVDLVLLDRVLPDIDGDLLAKLIKRRYPRLTIVAISAAPVRQVVPRMPIVDAFLAKPFDIDELLDLIGRLCPRGRNSRLPATVETARRLTPILD